ncbi:JAB domain-containing protein [Pedobacter sp. KBW06]|uniref:JAB domain-containing protein n=1 Tax=Pedobacter sp. KBW06 TaxID=2153359 RepID=UPI001F3ACA7D|nr:JAB domain-containing protein [Pedobacter sp. KBW06]
MKNNLYNVSQIELTYKPKVKASERPVIKCMEDVYGIFMQCWDKGKIELIEEFKMIVLDKGSAVLGVINISSGGMDSVIVDHRIVVTAAILAKASGVILAHNHPSSRLFPSERDIALTKTIKKAAASLNVAVVDHLIVTESGYYSFANKGLL